MSDSPVIEVDQPWQEYPHQSSPILFDARGMRRTASLFVEVSKDKNRDPIFTMKDYNYKGLLSAYEIYMDSVDEADAAVRLVGCLSHWRKLCRAKWFMEGNVEFGFEGLHQWRHDMLARDMTRAKCIYEARMQEGDLTAAKAMLALVKEMQSMYNVEPIGKKEGGKAASKSSAASRRGSQQPVGTNVVDLDDEFKRLLGN